MRPVITTLLAVLFLVGCGDSSPVGKLSLQQDPKASFEGFMQEYISNLQRVFDQEWDNLPATITESVIHRSKEGQKRPDRVLTDTCLYDVRKTDSLVQPYEGTISLKYSCEWKFFRDDPWKTQTHGWTLHFGWQEGRWVPTTKTYEGETTRIVARDSFWKAYELVKQ